MHNLYTYLVISLLLDENSVSLIMNNCCKYLHTYEFFSFWIFMFPQFQDTHFLPLLYIRVYFGIGTQSLSCIWLCATSWTVAHQASLSLSVEFSRQDYWSGLSFPPPGDLPNPGIKPASPGSPILQADVLPLSYQGSSSTSSSQVAFSLKKLLLKILHLKIDSLRIGKI